MVDGGDQQVARLGVEAGQQPLGPPEDRDRQLATIGSDIRMSADDRDPKCGRRCAHAVQHGGRAVLPFGPDRIDNRDGSTAHCRDIRDIDHDTAPTGEPRICGHEFVDKAFYRKQQKPIPIGNGRTVVTDRYRLSGEAEMRGHCADIGLGRNTDACP